MGEGFVGMNVNPSWSRLIMCDGGKVQGVAWWCVHLFGVANICGMNLFMCGVGVVRRG